MRRIIIVAIGVLSVSLVLFHYIKYDNYKCMTCQSKKHVSQLWLGVWWTYSIPVTPGWDQISESFLYKDFFDKNHEHDWRFTQGSPYYFFGTVWGGCELGRNRQMNNFCEWYENSPSEFREIVKAGIDSGELTPEIVKQIAEIPECWDNDPRKELVALAKKYVRIAEIKWN